MSAMSARRRKVAAVLAGALVPVVLLAGMLLPTSFEETEAGWVDTTEVEATVAAATIPAPLFPQACEYKAGLLGRRIEVYWTLPEGYDLADVQFSINKSGLGSVLDPITGFKNISTEYHGQGNYTTTIGVGLLSLGATMDFALAVEDSSGWTSKAIGGKITTGLLLGGTCSN